MKALAFSILILSSAASAATFSEPHAYLPMAGGKMTAGYATIKNESKSELKITGVSAAGFKAAEIHETFEKDGKAGMKKMETLVVPANGSVELKPGGKHIMLFEPARTFKEGDTVAFTFTVNGKPETAEFKMVPRPNTGH